MRLIDWTLVVLTGVAIGLGASADRASAQVVCDNLCRTRRDHFYNPSGPCVEFALTTCLLCSPGMNVLCSGPPVAGECKWTPTDHFVTYHDNCQLVCPGAGAAAVEAAVLGTGNNPLTVTRYVCEGATAPAP
jgi:hypothetical protein